MAWSGLWVVVSRGEGGRGGCYVRCGWNGMEWNESRLLRGLEFGRLRL